MAWWVAVGVWFGSGAAWAQPAFGPPPRPTAPPSAVRGLYDPAQPTPSPASVAPQAGLATRPTPPSAAPSTIPPTASSESSARPTPSSEARPLEGGEIVARVDGQIILASDVLWQVNQILEANRDRIPPQELDKARRVLLRQQVMGLIDTKLLYADFRRTVPEENIPQIEKNLVQPFEEHEVPRLIKMLQVKDRRELVDLLERHGSSLKDAQRQFGERTIAGEWLRQKATKPKPVTHEDMLAYYKEHQQEYEFPAQVKWEELMVRFDRFHGDRAAAWRAIAEMGNEVWQRAAKNPELRGAVCADIAKQKSHGFTAKDGGAHDWTTRGALRSEAINKALFSLKIGQLSNIIESERGFHIVRVLERKDAGRTPFTKAQAEIRKTIKQQRQKALVEAELLKLRKQSRVWTVFDGELNGTQVAELLGKKRRR